MLGLARRGVALGLALMVVAAPAAAVTTYYVDDAAGGGGTGSIGSPFTMDEANAEASFGETFVLDDGTYTDDISPANNGIGFAADSAICFLGLPCGNPTLTGVGSWADCDSADGTVIVSASTSITKDYVMFRGIRFTNTLTFTSAAAHDSVTFCTLKKIAGPSATNLVVFRNRFRVLTSGSLDDSTALSHRMLDFDAQNVPRGSVTIRRNRIDCATLGQARAGGGGVCATESGQTKCEDRAMWFRHLVYVAFDSNRVDVAFKKRSTSAYYPYESMALYVYGVRTWRSMDNKYIATCINHNRSATGNKWWWVLGWVRDSTGVVPGSNFPFTNSGGAEFLRDTMYACINNDSTSATFHLTSGNGSLGNLTFDQCVFNINADRTFDDDRGAISTTAGQVSGLAVRRCIIRNEIGPGISIMSPKMSGFIFENNTVWGKPALRTEASWDPHWIGPDQSKIMRNIFYNPSPSGIGVAAYLRMDKWDDGACVGPDGTNSTTSCQLGCVSPCYFGSYLQPYIDENLYWGGSAGNSYLAVGWSGASGGIGNYSCIASSSCTLSPTCAAGSSGCWYSPSSAPQRVFDQGSLYADPAFFTTSENSEGAWFGDIRYTSPAAALGWGAKPGYLDLPLRIANAPRGSASPEAPRRQRPAPITALDDSTRTTTSITVTWTHPGQDSFNVALSDTNSYTILVSPVVPQAEGFLDAESVDGTAIDPDWPYENLDFLARDTTITQRTWYRGRTNTVTMGEPGVKARATISGYYPLGPGIQNGLVALTADTKYYLLVMARNDAGYYGVTSGYLCAYTGNGGLACE